MASPRPLARDYKRTRQGRFDPGRWREFGLGLGAGLLVALAVFVWQRNVMQQLLRDQAVPRPQPRADAAGAATEVAAEPATGEAASQYDFYEMLPKFEVVVPEKEPEVRRELPAATIERPGAYVLQAGTFTKADDAQRVRAQLALAGITATVQRVAVDTNVWHRVRIGPLTDLAEVNATRQTLQGMDIEPLVIRVGD
jgi:cell division protein FtsN